MSFIPPSRMPGRFRDALPKHYLCKCTKCDFAFTDMEDYIQKIQNARGRDITDEEREIIRDRVYNTEIKTLTNAVENAIKAIESDPTVGYCMYGRRFQGQRNSGTIEYLGTVNDDGSLDRASARFPNLTNQMRQIIAISALQNARDAYMEEYDEVTKRAMNDQVTAAKRYDSETAKDAARKACTDWAENSQLPSVKTPTVSSDSGYTETFSAIATILFANPLLLIPGFITANNKSY